MHNLQQFVGVCVVVGCIRVPSHSGNTRGSVKAAAASSELHPVSRFYSETCRVVVFHFPDSPAPETLHARTPNAVLFGDAGGCSRWIPAGRHSSAHVLARCRLPHNDLSYLSSTTSWCEVCLETCWTWGRRWLTSTWTSKVASHLCRHVKPFQPQSLRRRSNSTLPRSSSFVNGHLYFAETVSRPQDHSS